MAGTLSFGIAWTLHHTEEAILSRSFEKTAIRVADHLRQGKEPHPEDDRRIFIFPDHDIPPAFGNARYGFSEMKEDGRDYWVYKHVDRESGKYYLIVEDQHDFEEWEDILAVILLVSLLAAVFGSFILGRLMARRVILPVSQLAGQVRGLSAYLPVTPLAEGYVDDEVGQLARAFDEVFARLRFSIEKERLFTSDVSHELRTPLMVISTSCELMLTSDLSPQGREQVERIAGAAREILALTETFLTLARAEFGKAIDQIDAKGITLNALVEEKKEQWTEAATAKGLVFQLHKEGENKGHYHAILLRAVMDNLIRNALYYTEEGWIRLTLEEGGFRVEDSGIGISDLEKKEIFQPFMHGAKTPGKGQGLGLSLVQRIVTQQGWQISLESLPEGGSRFTVRMEK
ncbi:MAG: HAMP domain-containing histidine kinase [Azoarcus sp.]|nr:HAMP domain-containing histidine kinase [Azoarcus sp.]